MGALVTFPWCFNFHCPAEELTGASLQNRIDRALDDHWIGNRRLRRVECVHLLVDGRQGCGLGNELFGLGVTGSGGEQRHHRKVNVWPQRFPGLMAYRAWKTS